MKNQCLLIFIITLFIACDAPDVKYNEPCDSEGKIANIRASNNKYVCSVLTENGVLVCDRDSTYEWEIFEVFDIGNGRITIKASNGKYVCADEGNKNYLSADRNNPREWETFHLIDMGNNKVVLEANSKNFVAIDSNNGYKLVANKGRQDEGEIFEIFYK